MSTAARKETVLHTDGTKHLGAVTYRVTAGQGTAAQQTHALSDFDNGIVLIGLDRETRHLRNVDDHFRLPQ